MFHKLHKNKLINCGTGLQLKSGYSNALTWSEQQLYLQYGSNPHFTRNLFQTLTRVNFEQAEFGNVYCVPFWELRNRYVPEELVSSAYVRYWGGGPEDVTATSSSSEMFPSCLPAFSPHSFPFYYKETPLFLPRCIPISDLHSPIHSKLTKRCKQLFWTDIYLTLHILYIYTIYAVKEHVDTQPTSFIKCSHLSVNRIQ